MLAVVVWRGCPFHSNLAHNDEPVTRPCRFDRQISIDRPDVTGREHMFRIHLAKLKLDKPLEYYSERMAALTPGFAGDEGGTIRRLVGVSVCWSAGPVLAQACLEV